MITMQIHAFSNANYVMPKYFDKNNKLVSKILILQGCRLVVVNCFNKEAGQPVRRDEKNNVNQFFSVLLFN